MNDRDSSACSASHSQPQTQSERITRRRLVVGQRLESFLTNHRYVGNTARRARRSDEALEVRVSVARIAPSLLDLGRGSPFHSQGTELFYLCRYQLYWTRGGQFARYNAILNVACLKCVCRGRSSRAVSTLASHQGDPGSISGRVTGFSQVGIVPDDAAGSVGFLGNLSPPPPPLPKFRCRSILTSIALAVKSRSNLFTRSNVCPRIMNPESRAMYILITAPRLLAEHSTPLSACSNQRREYTHRIPTKRHVSVDSFSSIHRFSHDARRVPNLRETPTSHENFLHKFVCKARLARNEEIEQVLFFSCEAMQAAILLVLWAVGPVLKNQRIIIDGIYVGFIPLAFEDRLHHPPNSGPLFVEPQEGALPHSLYASYQSSAPPSFVKADITRYLQPYLVLLQALGHEPRRGAPCALKLRRDWRGTRADVEPATKKAGNSMTGATAARVPAATADLAQAFTESGIVFKLRSPRGCSRLARSNISSKPQYMRQCEMCAGEEKVLSAEMPSIPPQPWQRDKVASCLICRQAQHSHPLSTLITHFRNLTQLSAGLRFPLPIEDMCARETEREGTNEHEGREECRVEGMAQSAGDAQTRSRDVTQEYYDVGNCLLSVSFRRQTPRLPDTSAGQNQQFDGVLPSRTSRYIGLSLLLSSANNSVCTNIENSPTLRNTRTIFCCHCLNYVDDIVADVDKAYLRVWKRKKRFHCQAEPLCLLPLYDRATNASLVTNIKTNHYIVLVHIGDDIIHVVQAVATEYGAEANKALRRLGVVRSRNSKLRGRGSVVVRLLASHLGEPGSTSGGVAPGFSHVGHCRWSTGFLGDLPFPPPFLSGAGPHSPQSPS
ncbi:hypothetical protein PR048_031398 [Dryococelus australis]|uniref:Uncharacterized protein n=1 Tax=Dryococelus australis TaxID=614101 RepID=A0ABQ9G7W1_9NEOP|nr:hypothetical protein PR048_031398 [Dryococelus australis]